MVFNIEIAGKLVVTPFNRLTKFVFMKRLSGLICRRDADTTAYSANQILSRLEQEGGENLYSDAINIAGAYIEGLPTDMALLFPQWGYWIGSVVITGPRFSIYQSQNLNEMENKLKSDPELLAKNKFLLVLSQNYLRENGLAADTELSGVAARSLLNLGDISTRYGRNGIDKVLLVRLNKR